jgi:hypothetical protein
MVRKHVVRNRRKNLVRGVVSGRIELRVIGSERAGFQLGGFLGETLVTLADNFRKQNEAIAYGQTNFGQKAKKLLAKVAA